MVCYCESMIILVRARASTKNSSLKAARPTRTSICDGSAPRAPCDAAPHSGASDPRRIECTCRSHHPSAGSEGRICCRPGSNLRRRRSRPAGPDCDRSSGQATIRLGATG
ncbi:hypothetical protein PHLGIDRAFT_404669 [Phlebiopsis gigantea 11061_1 CR5-6]|uniref:Uncharacterized protein n=1 Tax=Phlebiopsis gigantea (strain 11061_1 CR5-6) TaxID=745531 RepID=A0A0C3RZL8_PHLG1|nr:hypothetical protein PHLGIDRAFT_404669 [Phlebiopsis gigantea 11061_1 CR5-6]